MIIIAKHTPKALWYKLRFADYMVLSRSKNTIWVGDQIDCDILSQMLDDIHHCREDWSPDITHSLTNRRFQMYYSDLVHELHHIVQINNMPYWRYVLIAAMGVFYGNPKKRPIERDAFHEELERGQTPSDIFHELISEGLDLDLLK